jgi:hypothetical protein
VDLADQLHSMEKPAAEGWVHETARDAQGLWKWWTLLKPSSFIGYFLRNITGDLDALLAVRPQALKYVNQASRELYHYYSGRLGITDSLRMARDLGVISSSLTAQELPRLKDLKIFNRLYGSKKQNPATQLFDQIKRWNEFRESTLRYAAFLDYKNEISRGKLKDYGGANPKTVDALRRVMGDDVAAAHLSRNLLGDYGNITELGQYLRSYILPFHSWSEVNLKRWPRMAMNAYTSGALASKDNAVKAAALTGVALLRLGTWTAMMAAWNHLMFGDEEKELGPNERANPHLILGRREDGSIRILRNTGALGDFLEWGGLNTMVSLWPQYQTGQISAEEMLKEMAKDPINKVAQGLGPAYKVLTEVGMGVSTYPDVANPQPVARDEAAANVLGLRDEYRAAKGLVQGEGYRARPHYLEKALGIGTVDPRREMLSEIHALRERFLKRKGRPSVSVMTISDFRPLREAAYAGDYEAFKEARDAYLAKGNTLKKFVNSSRYLDPISNRLNDSDEQEFEQEFLGGPQRQRLLKVRDYAHQTQATLLAWWVRAAEESGDSAQQEEVADYIKKRRRTLLTTSRRQVELQPGEGASGFRARREEQKRRRVRAKAELEQLNQIGQQLGG